MRAITYILLTLSCLFALNVIIAATSPTYKTFLQEVKGNLSPASATTLARDKRLTAADIRTDKLIRSLDRLGDKVDSLELQTTPTQNVASGSVSQSGTTLTGSTQTGSVVTGTGSKTPADLTLPGSLLARLMPQFLPTKTENEGAFGIKNLEAMRYETYQDKKKKLKVYVFDTKYDFAKTYFKLNENLFKTNETDTFFSATFFLNPTKKDSIIRFVTKIENKTIGFEVMKKSYPLVKKLLTK